MPTIQRTQSRKSQNRVFSAEGGYRLLHRACRASVRTATNAALQGSTGQALMSAHHGEVPPILAQKHYDTPSAFAPESLLSERRRITSASIRSRLWP